MSPTEALDAQFEAKQADRAKSKAPDLFAEAERAREEAARAKNEEERADHTTRARLLLAAAVAEAERIELEERRLDAERRAARASEQTTRDLAARMRIEAALRREEAAQIAENEAAVAFARAEEDEIKRHRRNADERAALHRDAARVLIRRASLVLAAARAMGAPKAEVESLEGDLIRTEDSTPAIDEATKLLRRATELLAAARAATESATRDELRALVDDAIEARFDVEQQDRGVVVSIGSIFAGRSTRLARSAERRLGTLARLIAAHPHGPVRIEVHTERARSERAREALAKARGERLAKALSDEDIAAERLLVGVSSGSTNEARAGTVDIVFVHYGPSREAPLRETRTPKDGAGERAREAESSKTR